MPSRRHRCLRSRVWSPCPTPTSRSFVWRRSFIDLAYTGPQGLPQAWICAGRPLDGHDLMFETLRRLLCQPLVCFMLPSVCLTSATFRAVLYHIQDISRHFAVTGSTAKLSARLNKFLTLLNT